MVEHSLTALEIMHMTGEQFEWVHKIGVPAYREIQRSMRERGHCACAGCCAENWKRANATLAKLANQEARGPWTEMVKTLGEIDDASRN